MTEHILPWMGDIRLLMGARAAFVVCSVTAVLCGGMIGFERQRASKPTGLRTMILICLGSALFAHASMMMTAKNGDPSRIAAQVATGVGFLGAGAILREGGMLIGTTTAAGIWATAAVGVLVGSGHVASGLFISCLILAVLRAGTIADLIVLGRCRNRVVKLVFHPDAGKSYFRIESAMDALPRSARGVLSTDEQGRPVWVIRYCTVHPEHHLFLSQIADLPGLQSISEIPEQDSALHRK